MYVLHYIVSMYVFAAVEVQEPLGSLVGWFCSVQIELPVHATQW